MGRRAVPCPVGAEEINQRKAARHRKSRMHARTGERLPVLPALARAIDERRKNAVGLLQAASQAQPGETFTTAGQTLTRSVTTRPASGKIWADDPVTGKRRDLAVEEDLAFWAWAAVEVLRLTGVRVEELLEISHHSLIQYRLPGTGELIPLLQIVPSKTDTERLLVVSPELADVLSVIIRRVRGDTGTVPSSGHTTGANACGSARPRCCSSAGSALTAAGSATARSATCSTAPWPAPA